MKRNRKEKARENHGRDLVRLVQSSGKKENSTQVTESK